MPPMRVNENKIRTGPRVDPPMLPELAEKILRGEECDQ